jgi:hypothetical protein
MEKTNLKQIPCSNFFARLDARRAVRGLRAVVGDGRRHKASDQRVYAAVSEPGAD